MRLRFAAAWLGIVAAIGWGCAADAEDGTIEAKAKSPAASKKIAAKNADSKETPDSAKVEHATFGGGCFWCLEAVFERVKGVKGVVSGYAGGTFARPSYEMVCTGLTGHAEVVQVAYDPKVVTYDELLRVFWACHDPTTLNRQGPDEGTQYRSAIFFHDDTQKRAAQKSFDQVTAARVFSDPIVTQLVPLTKFYPAERYHQDYFRRHRSEQYCQMIIEPKLQMMKHKLDALPQARPAAEANAK